MDEIDLFKRLGLALAIGLMIGVERGQHTRNQSGGVRVAGVRSFSLIGLLGGLCGWLTTVLGPSFLGFAFVALAALVGLTYWVTSLRDGDLGITTEIAALLVFTLGAAAMLGPMAPVAAAGVVTAALLAAKSILHGWVREIRRFELTAAIQLAIISMVMLPLLPDQGFGPGGVLNPRPLWWAVVLIAGLSFAGYLAIRIAGARSGTLLAGLLGGLASSTATTLAFSRIARRAQPLAPSLAVGVVLAGSVAFLRIHVVASVLNGSLGSALTVPMLVMAAVGFAGALALRAVAGASEEALPDARGLSNPLELASAVTFGALLAVVAVATEYFQAWFGAAGVYGVAILSGIADVDAVTVSMARMADDEETLAVATCAVVLAASVNTAVKATIALAVGGAQIGLRVSAVSLVVLMAGGVSVALDWDAVLADSPVLPDVHRSHRIAP